jgi:hydrophobe/amphiphile efflux-1 (HAE1) family protein
MSLYKSSVKKPITTLMIFIGIVILGIYSLINVPIDFLPDIEYPAITVFTVYQGAGASDIEENVTKKLENALNTVSNIKDIESKSRDNLSVVTLIFEWGTNLDEAANDIRDAIGLVDKALPEDAEKPVIFKFSSSMMPIEMLSVTADESYEALTNIIDEKIVSPLNRIDGIGSVSILGGPKRAVQVNVDPRKLEAYNISIEQIAQTIRSENFNLPSGNIEMGDIDYPLRVTGEFQTSDQIKNIVIGERNNKTIYLKDIATVSDTIKKLTTFETINGKKGIRLMIQKQSGANTVQIAKKVNKKLEILKQKLPPDIKIDTIFDSSDFIVKSINNLSTTLLFAGIFVILIVLFFLGRWRATFIIILTIPISLIVAFIYLNISGNSINIISLSSLSIAIGMVVDDAIVVLENITRHIERGSTPREAAIYGTNEVGLAVVATTLTVVAVFFPLTFVGGMTGILFKQLGMIVTITVTVSTITALSLTPMLSSKLLKLKLPKKGSFSEKFSNWHNKSLNKLDNFYQKILVWSVRHKTTVIISSILIFILSLLLIPLTGTEFMPASDNSQISASVELTTGIKLDETKKIAQKIEKIINEKYPEVKLISTSAGSGEGGGIVAVFQKTSSFIINYRFRLSSETERKRSAFEISDLLRQDLDKIPEIASYSVEGGEGSTGGENNVEVEIFGYSFNETSQIAEELAQGIKKIKGTRDIVISRDKEKPELQIIFDRDKLASLGLNTYTVANAVRNRITGLLATKYREQGNEYDVIVKYADEFKGSISDIENINIINRQGKIIKLKEIGRVKQFYSPPNIERKNKERVVKVSATLHGNDLGTVTKKIEQQIAQMNVSSDIDFEIGGSAKDMQDSFSDLKILLILIILLVYIVMASQFESFREPFIIMLSIPFSFTGVFLALVITGTTLNVISMIGAIMLVGIVVKNAIVMVDYTNLMRDRGYSITQSVLISGKSRLRPVLMTTLTTLLAMAPLAISSGEGAETWRPMGIAIIGGLTFSTLITLIFIPVVYSVFGAARVKKARKIILKKNGFKK